MNQFPGFWLASKVTSFTEARNRKEDRGGLGKGRISMVDVLSLTWL